MTDCLDTWPSTDLDVADLFVEMDRSERRRIRFREPDPVRRARIVDLAGDRLWCRIRADDAPARPRAWFRTVVDNLLKSDEISRDGEARLEDWMAAVSGGLQALDELRAERAGHQMRTDTRRRCLRARLPWLLDDARLRAVVTALMGHGNLKPAARSLGMAPSNFRRALDRATQIILAETARRAGR